MDCKLIIFDLDGTLANTLSDITNSANKILSQEGFPVHSEHDYRYFLGDGLKKLVERSLPAKARTELLIEKCYKKVFDDYELNFANKTTLYEGIPELLNALTSTEIKMAILSNKADVITQKICNKLLSQWDFKIIMGASDRFPRKPDPKSAIHISKTLMIAPQNILFVGDSNVDVQTAKAAGFSFVGVSWGFRTKEELINSGAGCTINKPDELLKTIGIL